MMQTYLDLFVVLELLAVVFVEDLGLKEEHVEALEEPNEKKKKENEMKNNRIQTTLSPEVVFFR